MVGKIAFPRGFGTKSFDVQPSKIKLIVSLNGVNFKTFVQFVKILKHGKTDPDANNPQMVKLE